MSIQVRLGLSDGARKAHAVATGKVLPEVATVTMPFEEMGEAERRQVVEVLGLPNSDQTLSIVAVFHGWREAPFRSEIVPQTTDDWMLVVAAYQTTREQFAAEITAERTRNHAEQEAQEVERAAKRAADMLTCDAQLAALEALDDAALLDHYDEHRSALGVSMPYPTVPHLDARYKALSERVNALWTVRDRIAREQAEVERAAWIAEHGSDYLKKATSAGYNCQRRYVIERAAMELPGYHVDYKDRATWKTRSCPSADALDEMLALQEQGREVIIVWLTHCWNSEQQHEYDGCDVLTENDDGVEAIIVRNYLGKYDAIKVAR